MGLVAAFVIMGSFRFRYKPCQKQKQKSDSSGLSFEESGEPEYNPPEPHQLQVGLQVLQMTEETIEFDNPMIDGAQPEVHIAAALRDTNQLGRFPAKNPIVPNAGKSGQSAKSSKSAKSTKPTVARGTNRDVDAFDGGEQDTFEGQ